MSKKEQLIEYCIQDIIEYIVNDDGVEYDIAMKRFYSSETFDKLNDEETGLYLESSAYIYDLFINECIYGKLVQLEI